MKSNLRKILNHPMWSAPGRGDERTKEGGVLWETLQLRIAKWLQDASARDERALRFTPPVTFVGPGIVDRIPRDMPNYPTRQHVLGIVSVAGFEVSLHVEPAYCRGLSAVLLRYCPVTGNLYAGRRRMSQSLGLTLPPHALREVPPAPGEEWTGNWDGYSFLWSAYLGVELRDPVKKQLNAVTHPVAFACLHGWRTLASDPQYASFDWRCAVMFHLSALFANTSHGDLGPWDNDPVRFAMALAKAQPKPILDNSLYTCETHGFPPGPLGEALNRIHKFHSY
jgi:hypothetical protein